MPLKLLSPETFFSPKCTKCHLAAGLCQDPLGELTAFPRPLAGWKKDREGSGEEERGRRAGAWEEECRKEWGWKREYASLALGGGRPVNGAV